MCCGSHSSGLRWSGAAGGSERWPARAGTSIAGAGAVGSSADRIGCPQRSEITARCPGAARGVRAGHPHGDAKTGPPPSLPHGKGARSPSGDRCLRMDHIHLRARQRRP